MARTRYQPAVGPQVATCCRGDCDISTRDGEIALAKLSSHGVSKLLARAAEAVGDEMPSKARKAMVSATTTTNR